jgi:hypothetical protein
MTVLTLPNHLGTSFWPSWVETSTSTPNLSRWRPSLSKGGQQGTGQRDCGSKTSRVFMGILWVLDHMICMPVFMYM